MNTLPHSRSFGASLRRCAGAAFLFVALAGCSGSADRLVKEEGPSVADQIKQIESNTNMPESQKAAIIAQLRQQEAVSSQRGQAAAK